MLAKRSATRRWSTLLAAACAACSSPHEENTAERGFDIIGGVRAASPELDHTGALVYHRRDTGASGLLCSATLIGPQTLVTANHCVVPLDVFARIGIDVLWTRGANFREPEEAIELAGFVPSPIAEGSALGYGADVAVIHLARPATAHPVLVRPFSHELLGQSLVTVGFGVSSAAGVNDGWRRIGRETVVATSGLLYEAIFGDFDSFVAWQQAASAAEPGASAGAELAPSPEELAELRAEYESWQLMADYELYAGNAPGDTQSCEGDSGGPLGRFTPDGDFETFGVVSGGTNSVRSMCDHGQVFATFGPEVFALLERERGWTSSAP